MGAQAQGQLAWVTRGPGRPMLPEPRQLSVWAGHRLSSASGPFLFKLWESVYDTKCPSLTTVSVQFSVPQPRVATAAVHPQDSSTIPVFSLVNLVSQLLTGGKGVDFNYHVCFLLSVNSYVIKSRWKSQRIQSKPWFISWIISSELCPMIKP